MHAALDALLNDRHGIDLPTWRSFWDQLRDGGLARGESVAVLASMASRLPDADSLQSLLESLAERRPATTVELDESVNIVGTGGGPKTFNISTAAAFVAAAMGVRVVKTGSRGYTSGCGSVDLLEKLGIGLTSSYEQTLHTLDRFGIAFAGYFVYPGELALLAKSIFPMGMRSFGRFLNPLGPFLASLPVSAQVTGVSAHSVLPTLRRLAASVDNRTVWLCANDLGADELLGFADNVIYTNEASSPIVLPRRPLPSAGTLHDLRPADASSVVGHFLDVLGGHGGPVATHTICLNAASMAVASRQRVGWADALEAAGEAVRSGAALELAIGMKSSMERKPFLEKVGAHA